MCDTLFFRKEPAGDDSLFAKNSDRDPAERQIFHYAPGSRQLNDTLLYDPPARYLEGPFLRLAALHPSFTHPYGAFISRPVWMWGAEMGVNEHGVAIGNEALFSLRTPPSRDGLLGMDLLRLALHNARSAQAALDLLIRLIEDKGQGGSGSEHGTLLYHNGFLITDPESACILETAGRAWAWKQVKRSGSISNDYSLGTPGIEADRTSPGENRAEFGRRHRSPLHNLVTRGSSRRRRSSRLAALAAARPPLAGTGSDAEPGDRIFQDGAAILRDHDGKGMSSICMHSPPWPRSGTTASLMVRYHKERFMAWYTGAPRPCGTIFKPACFEEAAFGSLEEEFPDSPAVVARFENERNAALARKTGYEKERDALEARLSAAAAEELCCGTAASLARVCRDARQQIESFQYPGVFG